MNVEQGKIIPLFKERAETSLNPKYVASFVFSTVVFCFIFILTFSFFFTYDTEKAIAPYWSLFIINPILNIITFHLLVRSSYEGIKKNKQIKLHTGGGNWTKNKMDTVVQKIDFDDLSNYILVHVREFDEKNLIFFVTLTVKEIEKISFTKKFIKEKIKTEIKEKTGFDVTGVFFKITYYDF